MSMPASKCSSPGDPAETCWHSHCFSPCHSLIKTPAARGGAEFAEDVPTWQKQQLISAFLMSAFCSNPVHRNRPRRRDRIVLHRGRPRFGFIIVFIFDFNGQGVRPIADRPGGELAPPTKDPHFSSRATMNCRIQA